MAQKASLSDVLKKQQKRSKRREGNGQAEDRVKKDDKNRIEELQLELLRIQQGVWLRKARAIIVFEGFDAAGKGGCIRTLTEVLDPRGVVVHPIGPPTEREQGTHWLYRFWTRLPPPGKIAIFDRSWYGRVLVERVEKLAPKEAWKRAYREIREFERMLADDGVDLIKFFLAVSEEEQLQRFRDRMQDPYKQWKLTMADVKARACWDEYVEATDDLLAETNTGSCPWRVVPADDKTAARLRVLEEADEHFAHHRKWLEAQRKKEQVSEKEVARALRELGKARRKKK